MFCVKGERKRKKERGKGRLKEGGGRGGELDGDGGRGHGPVATEYLRLVGWDGCVPRSVGVGRMEWMHGCHVGGRKDGKRSKVGHADQNQTHEKENAK